MNSMILPNVTLGDHTIVAAGAVVTSVHAHSKLPRGLIPF